MLEGYKPIDFGGMFGQVPPDQIRNRVGLSQAAVNILANSQFSKTPVLELMSKGFTPGASGALEAPKRQQTLWGRVSDLLSTPMYAVSNAVDDALAGHQSSDTDSVISDAGQIIGGYVTGAGRGLGTGLRGAFAPSEIAADPMDKIYLGDALVRFDTHMSAEDAMKPENREEVRQRLMNKKINQFSDDPESKYFYNFDKGRVEVTDEDIDNYFRDMKLYGFASSAIADPLNFITGPVKVAQATAEVPEVISGSKNIYEGFKAPVEGTLNASDIVRTPTVGKTDGTYRVKLPPGAIQNRVATPEGIVSTPEWFNFPRSVDELINPAPVIPSVDDAVTIGGKSRPMQSLQYTPGTSTAITQEAWDEAIKLFTTGQHGLPIDGIMRTKHNLSPDAIDEIRKHLLAGTKPAISTAAPVSAPVNQLDPLDDILGNWASGSSVQSIRQHKNIIPARAPDAQLKLAEDLMKPKGNKYFTKEILTGLLRGNAEQTLKRLFPGGNAEKLTRLQIFVKHMQAYPDLAKMMAIPEQRKKVYDALQRVLRAESEALKTPNIIPAKNLINDANVDNIALVEKARPAPYKSKNPKRDAAILQGLVDKFEGAISGAKAPSQIKNVPLHLKEVATGKRIAYSDKQQVNPWNQLTHVLKDVKSPARFDVALNLLREFENMMIAKGYKPMSHHIPSQAFPIRLSQVLEAIGPAAAAMNPTLLTKILRGEDAALRTLPADVVQRIEEIKAAEALVEAPNVVKGIDTASKSIEDLIKSGPLSAARQEEIITIGSRVADDITKMAGGSPTAGTTAAKAVKEEFAPKNPIDSSINANKLNTTALISHPDVSPSLLAKYSNAPAVAKAINKTIGGPSPRTLGTKSGRAALAIEWLGARFNAAYKNPEMRPIYLRNAASAKSTVAKRAEYLNRLAKKYDVNDADLWNDALKGAQGVMPPVDGTQAAALSKEILEIMENLFGSSGFRKGMVETNTVAGRSQLFMNELNTNLRRFGLGQYRFTKTDDGTSWLNTWQKWEINKPLDFLFKIQNVVEHTVREKIMFDEIGARWGSTVKSGEFTHKVNHPRLAHLYFGKDAAEQATTFVRNLKQISQTNSKQMQMFDKAVSKWKAAVTIYVPSHHIRNLIGDLYFNWMGGVNSSRAYSTALKVMQSQKGRYEGLDELNKLTDPNTLMMALQGKLPSNASGKQIALTTRGGRQVTNDELYVTAFQQGILPTTRVLEDIPDDAVMGFERFRPLGGKGQKAAHTISEGRDHYIRLAHYADALKKSNKPFAQAVEEAATTVRKWHPDGMDLTKFERNVMRRMFPFYSWTRKAIPLIVESMVATPGKVMAYPKAMYGLQLIMGTEGGPMSDPFPVDQLFPDWIREKGIGPAFSPESELPLIGNVAGFLGGTPGYSVVNPGNPTMDTIAQLDNPGKMAMGMLNPAARIPIELSTGRDTQSGAPIEGVSDPDYIIKQIPGVSHAGRITGEFGTSDTVKENSSGYNMQNILNLLTALGAQNTGPYQKSAEFDLREYLKNLRS